MDVKELEHLPLMEIVIKFVRKHEDLKGKLELMKALTEGLEQNPQVKKEIAESLAGAAHHIPEMERRLLEYSSIIYWLGRVRT